MEIIGFVNETSIKCVKVKLKRCLSLKAGY